jgi:DNA helicase II / ATP-dependent DNA helicase PcrA
MPDKQLNPQQIEAITHGEGPLLIIAGAGTGKTTVVTERVKHLITQNKATPEQILALTFTEKAAREMEERIDMALPYGYAQMWTMTFHSFCDRLLRDEGIHIGINPGFKLISDTTATSMIRKHIFDWNLEYFLPLGNPNKFIAGILQHIGRLKDEDVSSDNYLTWVNDGKFEDELEKNKYQELSRIYKAYEDLKTKEGVMDFSDLICTTLQLFRSRPNILKNYQNRFKYILVDEFQDTNFAQNQLVNLLAGYNKNLTVVADDDQAIYRWRGAAISNVIQFRENYPTAKLVTLTLNYRSTQEILDRSYDLIQHNNPDRLEVKENIDKKLKAIRIDKGTKIELIHCDRVENEADAVAVKISKLKSENPDLEFKDIAILIRANAHADPFSRSLYRHNIPFQFLGPAQLFQQPEVKDLIAYLRVLNHIFDDISFYRVAAMEYFKIPPRDLAALGGFAKAHNIHLFEVAEIAAGKSQLKITTPLVITDPGRQILSKLVDIIHKHLGLLAKETAGQILFYFLQDSGMLKSVMDYELPLDEKKATNITRFFNKLKSFEIENLDASVASAVEWIDLSMELGESPLAAEADWTQNDAVNIITIHSAKGLEFKIVFLVNMVSQRFPSMARQEQIPLPESLIQEILPEGDYHLQEERRLCYVGMTRAKDQLYLTAADFYGDAKREKKLSPFIAEALGANYIARRDPALQDNSQLSLLDWNKPAPAPIPEIIIKTDAFLPPITYLSYTQIQTFLDCPLHYRARYHLKIPSQPTASLSFGSSIHNTLKEFFADPSQEISALYHKNWLPEGYLNSEQAKLFFAKGETFLNRYLEAEYNPSIKTVSLEQMFTAPLTFNKRFIKIGGKIDRVDLLSDGSIEIIDYKTGANSLTEKEAQSNLQLSFYALAATLMPNAPFGRKPEEIKLSLYYFDEQKKVSVVRTAEQLEEAKEKIFEIADQIAKSDFKCTHGMFCKNCEFKMLCDIA